MKFYKFIEHIKNDPKLKITVKHKLIDDYVKGKTLNGIIVRDEIKKEFKKELDEGLPLDDFLRLISYHFLPSELVKIFSEGEFEIK